ncbi:sigma factor-like helix-turn-helix DNA-binding protein [Hespellia stercorisuis]|uniref:RNA polymerase sigma factor, sigma-70 family n=1 Tax=Hespellia stercorisuis DSM 15480 TaxID=1121950 RepID=A0A1M6RF69_9FIRM|nr:sigma factor-like helix-turn-helix DNA-binding protein [Hespellia stercorisuis]SHK31036.1 RNA polymerase sigma factor, sigma-70 family [Hespellia stercorisuis DSM 15480]
MDKSTLKQYKSLLGEIPQINTKLDKLYKQRDNIQVVQIKVTKSGDDFPYIEEHLTVKADEPREADEVNKRIRLYELRLDEAERMQREIEEFIAGIPDSTDRQIFELSFLEGKKQREVADAVGYTQGRVSQIISCYLQD